MTTSELTNAAPCVRLAVAPIAWTNDDLPELGGDTPLETCLAQSRAAGFCGTELGGKFPRSAAALQPLLAKHELVLASGWFSGLLFENDSVETEMQRMQAQLTCFAELGVKTLFYADTSGSVQTKMDVGLSHRPRIPDVAFAAWGEKLTTLAERMQSEYGIAMAFHHHMGTLIETPQEVAALMQHTGEAVGLLVDSGHIAFAGGSGVALLRNYAARVRYIHCKDLREAPLAAVRKNDSSFMQAVLDGVFTVPGDGCLDFQAFVNAVAEVGYRGWMVVEAEQDPSKAEPLHYSRMGYEHICACCEKAGVQITTQDIR